MATTIRARIYARGEVSFAKFLFLPTWFAKLLEVNFSCFAKIIWMPSWFVKLLELLLELVLCDWRRPKCYVPARVRLPCDPAFPPPRSPVGRAASGTATCWRVHRLPRHPGMPVVTAAAQHDAARRHSRHVHAIPAGFASLRLQPSTPSVVGKAAGIAHKCVGA
jgi:hypothetical protein